jgi:hypothetical protein
MCLTGTPYIDYAPGRSPCQMAHSALLPGCRPPVRVAGTRQQTIGRHKQARDDQGDDFVRYRDGQAAEQRNSVGVAGLIAQLGAD